MNVSINCKLSIDDAWYFIEPLTNVDSIKKIHVYRDETSVTSEKVMYHPSGTRYNSFIRLITRFFKMLMHSDTIDVYIGIYEIPHGLMAYLISIIKRKPFILCIISNPGYTKLRKGLRLTLTQYLMRKSLFITTTGSKSREYLIKQGFNPDKIKILPNSINVDFFKPVEVEKKYDILNLGRLSPEKRIVEFVEIISEVKKSFPTIKVAIAGKGPDRNRIEQRIKELALEENIALVGYINNAHLINFYNSSKIFVMCSETEGFPRTIIQSIACGVPCISTDVGDISDLISDNRSGFLIEEFDTKKVADKITILLSDIDLYTSFRTKGLCDVREKYAHSKAIKIWNEFSQIITHENYSYR